MLIKDARKINDCMAGLMGKKLPIKMAFAVQKNNKKIQEIVEFADERQNDIVQRCAKRDEDGNFVAGSDGKGIAIEDVQTFMTEMNELNGTDMDIDLVMISMLDVEKCDEDRYDSLSPNDMQAIECMIEG